MHLFTALAIFAATALGSPFANVKRQVSELRDSYDIIIAGGGTAGLTVADRVTQALPSLTVLVVEYGVIEEGVGQFEPAGSPAPGSRWSYDSLPIPALNNRSASLMVGKVVGGSSVINGQFFDRGSKFDYNDWKAIGSPDFDSDAEKWDWDGIAPFFRKSVTFQVPSKEEVDAFGYTWDATAYNGTGPIQSSYPPFQWPMQKVAWDAWVEFGLEARTECANGDKHGVCWVPTSQDPITAKRSHAGVGHYKEVIGSRKNFDLLVQHKVTRVIYGDDPKAGPPKVEIQSLTDKSLQVASAKLEVVLSAGAIHTPQILQRSGIGNAPFLAKAGIKLVANLPGVGYNFQDHGGGGITATLAKQLTPNQGTIGSNRTYGDEALKLYSERPAKGPYTLAMGNSAIYVSLPKITSTYKDIAAKVRKQVESGAETFLPAGTPPEVIAGYKAQLSILANTMENPEQAVLETPFQGGAGGLGFLLKPTSRGTVMLNVSNHDAEPLIDYRSASNPIDLEVIASFVPFFRKYLETPTMKEYGARETQPGARVQSTEDIIDYLRGTVTGSFQHPSGTAAMMPKSKGGVVGSNLRVHDVAGLSVIDCSIIPIIPGTHTSATAYAIGEKGADILIRRWSSPA